MKTKYFDNYTDISEFMYMTARDGKYVVTTLFVDDAMELMRELLAYDDVEIGGIDLSQPQYNGYSKEYYVSLGDDLILDIEPAWNGKTYLTTEPDIMLIVGDAKYAIIQDIPKDKCYEIYIGESYLDEETVYNNDEDDDALDMILDKAKVLTDEDNNPVSIEFDITDLITHLLG